MRAEKPPVGQRVRSKAADEPRTGTIIGYATSSVDFGMPRVRWENADGTTETLIEYLVEAP
jgi:hypothetical protein